MSEDPTSHTTRDLFIKTILPVLLTAGVGYLQTQSKSAELFDLLSNYREYIIEVEMQGHCPCGESLGGTK